MDFSISEKMKTILGTIDNKEYSRIIIICYILTLDHSPIYNIVLLLGAQSG